MSLLILFQQPEAEIVDGIITATQANNTASVTGNVAVSAVITATQANNTASVTVELPNEIEITAVQEDNTATLSGNVENGINNDPFVPSHSFAVPKKKSSKKKVQPVEAVKELAAPTPEEIQALTEALLLGIPVDDSTQVDFDELRTLIAKEQARINLLRQQAEEEEFAVALLLAHHHRRKFFRSNV